MTNDTQASPTVDPLAVLVNSAQAVVDAEEALLDVVRQVKSVLDNVEYELDHGSMTNSLGSLQGAGPRLDVCCGRLELAVRTFESTWRYLSPAMEPDARMDTSHADYAAWVRRLVVSSPRLRRVTEDR